MTPRERIIVAIRHRETSPVPWCIDFTAEAEDTIRQRYGPGWIDAIGNCIVTVPHPCWQFVAISDAFKNEECPPGLPEARGTGGGMDEFHARVDRLGQSDRFTLVRWYASLWEKAWMARGMERLMADLVLNPSFAERLFDKIVHINLCVLDLILENPHLDGVLFGSDWGGQDKLLMNPDMRGCSTACVRPASFFSYIHAATSRPSFRTSSPWACRCSTPSSLNAWTFAKSSASMAGTSVSGAESVPSRHCPMANPRRSGARWLKPWTSCAMAAATFSRRPRASRRMCPWRTSKRLLSSPGHRHD